MTDRQQKMTNALEREMVQARICSNHIALPGGNRGAIIAGLQFLSSNRHGRKWICSRHGSEVWTTAYVLARLGELPHGSFSHSLQQQIQDSLDWLECVQTRGGGWSFAPGEATDDASCTAWAILASRQHGRLVSSSAREFLCKSRHSNGAFASNPHNLSAPAQLETNRLDVTAIAIRALGIVTSSSAEWLEQGLRTTAGLQPAFASALFVCSDILDWEPGVTPLSLRSQVYQSVSHLSGNSALEQALLLRCLARLRMQQTSTVAAELCRMQRADGAWSGLSFAPTGGAPLFIEDSVIATVTAVSALAMRDLQPGLYFGSEVPFRRLEEV
ncbi:MAG TPA: hypothetical protein VE133_11280 [Candidatus Sulfotelmatobacter sp.]|nr:hypothetical protein [Candidatus Sulfotelmatobacter sp.]